MFLIYADLCYILQINICLQLHTAGGYMHINYLIDYRFNQTVPVVSLLTISQLFLSNNCGIKRLIVTGILTVGQLTNESKCDYIFHFPSASFATEFSQVIA